MQTTYNAFGGSAPASNDNAFQSAIDYLIANRQKPVFNNQGGLFASTDSQTQAETPTTNISSVVGRLFGEDYQRGSGGSAASRGEDTAVGNPYSRDAASFRSPFGVSGIDAVNNYRDIATSLRNNAGGVGTVAGLLSGNPLVGVAVKYGAPALFDYLGNQAYQSYISGYDSSKPFTDWQGNPITDDFGPGAPSSVGYNDYTQSRGSGSGGGLSIGRSYDGGGSYSNSDQAARDAGNES